MAYLNSQMAKMVAAKNGLTGDDLKAVEDAIAELQSIIDEVKVSEDDVTAEETLQKMVESLNEKVQALTERVDNPEGNKLHETDSKNFLASKEACSQWLNAMRGAADVNDFRSRWHGILSENGITIAEGSEEAFMPEAVRGRIHDAWERNSNWLNALNNTGAKVFYARVNNSDEEVQTAHGWPNNPTSEQLANGKTLQELSLSGKKIEAMFVYKMINVSNKTVWDDDEALLTYIVDELFTAWRRAICRAILVGQSDITTVEPVARQTTDSYVTVVAYDDNEAMVDNIVAAAENIISGEDTELFLFVNKSDLNKMRRVLLSASATPQYVSAEEVARQLGVTRIIETNLVGGSDNAVRMILLRPDLYTTVGAIEPVFSEQEEFRTNQHLYRVEIPFGGAVSGLKAAAVLTQEVQ